MNQVRTVAPASPCSKGGADSVEYQFAPLWNVTSPLRVGPEPPLRIALGINGHDVEFELDTGASFTMCSQESFERFAEGSLLCSAEPLRLQTWSGENIPLVGKADVNVTFGSKTFRLTLYVAEGRGISLLGRDWLRPLGLRVVADTSFPVNRVDDEAVADRVGS